MAIKSTLWESNLLISRKVQIVEYRNTSDSIGPQLKAITVLSLNSYEFYKILKNDDLKSLMTLSL